MPVGSQSLEAGVDLAFAAAKVVTVARPRGSTGPVAFDRLGGTHRPVWIGWAVSAVDVGSDSAKGARLARLGFSVDSDHHSSHAIARRAAARIRSAGVGLVILSSCDQQHNHLCPDPNCTFRRCAARYHRQGRGSVCNWHNLFHRSQHLDATSGVVSPSRQPLQPCWIDSWLFP